MIKELYSKARIVLPLLLVLPLFFSHTALATPTNNDFLFSDGFSSTQGQNQWYYKQWNGSSYTDMTWDGANSRWKGTPAFTLIGQGWMHPDSQDAVLAWKAPRTGMIAIRGVIESRIENTTGSGM